MKPGNRPGKRWFGRRRGMATGKGSGANPRRGS